MIRLKVTLPTVPTIPQAGMTDVIRQRFQNEAGTMILDAVRSLLGTSAIYTLTPEYSSRKSKMKGFRREGGKASDQPLIFSGEGIFDALTVIPNSTGFVVQVDDSQGMRGSYDYAEHFQDVTDYLGKGLDLVEDQLDELLATIIEQELLF